MKVFVISRSGVNTQALLGICNQLVGKNLTSQLDKRSKRVDTPEGFITILSNLKADVTPEQALENPGHILQHCYYGIGAVVSSPVTAALLEEVDLEILVNHIEAGLDFIIMTGNLERWRTTIINHLSPSSALSIRTVMSNILTVFDQEGLGRLFSGFKRDYMPDRTIKLIEKK